VASSKLQVGLHHKILLCLSVDYPCEEHQPKDRQLLHRLIFGCKVAPPMLTTAFICVIFVLTICLLPGFGWVAAAAQPKQKTLFGGLGCQRAFFFKLT